MNERMKEGPSPEFEPSKAEDWSTPDGDAAVDITVVVPTYNRRDRLRRVLEALDCQDTTTKEGRRCVFDAVVVSDGSTDGTVEMVSAMRTSYGLKVIEQENAGPAAARNLGVASTSAPLILFIDDDVVPEPGCIAAHVTHHVSTPDLVVIGPMLTPTDAELSPWVAWEQHQLYKQYQHFARGEPAHHRQFYTGNASVRRSAFLRTGGFDTTFRRAEDVELAYRLHVEGQSFVFEPDAEAFHYAERSLESWTQVAFDYGLHDVSFGTTQQPWVLDQIAWMFSERHIIQRAVVLVSLQHPRLATIVQRLLASGAITTDNLGLRSAGRLMLSGAYGISYYSGVVAGLGSRDAFSDLVRGRRLTDQFCAVFVLEQTLGHVTHSKNLQSLIPRNEDLTSVFLPVDSSLTRRARRVPGWSNWTVRAGIRARSALRRLYRSDQHLRANAMFVHSQVPAVLLGGWMRRIPTVVSLDATPEQYDHLGTHYSHGVGPAPIERVKHWANRKCFSRARHLVTWSEWAKQGLVDSYGVSPSEVTVIAPGVDIETWAAALDRADQNGPVRILFVGADAKRKGGEMLIEAARRLRQIEGVPAFEVHMVTASDLPAEVGLYIHTGLSANSPELIEQYRLADIFCLPTFGDCLPMVLAEAGAAGLPLVSTDVGAISELVRDGQTGRLIEAGDADGLTEALAELLTSEEKRLEYGRGALMLVERDHDAAANAARIVALLRETVK